MTPVCVVGHLIHRLEPETFQAMVDIHLANVDETGDESNIATLPVENLTRCGIHLPFEEDRSLMNALCILQATQDSGSTWAEALVNFKKALETGQ